jgi:hypothetical protein
MAILMEYTAILLILRTLIKNYGQFYKDYGQKLKITVIILRFTDKNPKLRSLF